MTRFTRRSFGAILSGAPLPWLAEGGPLTWEAQPGPGSGGQRRYRADAQVLLFSIPLLKRRGVGDGHAIWREARDEGGEVLTLLEFMGASDPKNAAGLNRFGFIRELSRGNEESIYFGLMTSSPEETAEQARDAHHTTAAEVAYSAIGGSVKHREIETSMAQFTAPAQFSATDRTELIERARRALSVASKKTASQFRLWVEDGVRCPLPLRIEYQPKSYLRLAFEAEG